MHMAVSNEIPRAIGIFKMPDEISLVDIDKFEQNPKFDIPCCSVSLCRKKFEWTRAASKIHQNRSHKHRKLVSAAHQSHGGRCEAAVRRVNGQKSQ